MKSNQNQQFKVKSDHKAKEEKFSPKVAPNLLLRVQGNGAHIAVIPRKIALPFMAYEHKSFFGSRIFQIYRLYLTSCAINRC